METYVPKSGDIERRWHLVDARDVVLGRLCTVVARCLTGKNKAMFTPHIDTGDHVVVINAAEVKMTGKKAGEKLYHRHTGYPGGLKTETAAERRVRHPERIIMTGVRGMLPKTKLGRKMLTKLRVYAGAEHPHEAQQPVSLVVKS